MLFDLSEYADVGIDPEAVFRTTLPGADILRDTVLDPGLATDVKGVAGRALQTLIQRRSLLDALHLQQFAFFDVGRAAGCFQTYAPVMRDMLQAVTLGVETGNAKAMGRELAKTAVGAVGQVLSQSGNPYAMVAGAVIGFANMIFSLFENGPLALPTGSLPLQEYSETTDEDQFNTIVRAHLQTRDWTPLFLPRFDGLVSIQYRQDAIKRQALAFALGDGTAGQDAKFSATGGLGFLPGANRVTSVVQSIFREPPRAEAPFFSTRAGDCGARVTIGQDVGAYYPATNQGLFMVWESLRKVSPGMYCVDVGELGRAWNDYFAAWTEGLARWWKRQDMFALWGIGGWRCAMADVVQRLTAGKSGLIGPGIGGGLDVGLDSKGHHFPVARWEESTLWNRIIYPALTDLTKRQLWYVENTTASAYIPPGAAFFRRPRAKAIVEEHRKRILLSAASEIRPDDVLDEEYRREVIRARINVFKQPGDVVWEDTGDGVAAPPRQRPPKSEPPKGGNPFGEYVPASATPFLGLGLAGVAAWYFSRSNHA